MTHPEGGTPDVEVLKFSDRDLDIRERNVVCTRCGESKPPAEFRRNPRKSNGLSSWCAACHTAATAAWRGRNPEYVDAYNESRREARRSVA